MNNEKTILKPSKLFLHVIIPYFILYIVLLGLLFLVIVLGSVIFLYSNNIDVLDIFKGDIFFFACFGITLSSGLISLMISYYINRNYTVEPYFYKNIKLALYLFFIGVIFFSYHCILIMFFIMLSRILFILLFIAHFVIMYFFNNIFYKKFVIE